MSATKYLKLVVLVLFICLLTGCATTTPTTVAPTSVPATPTEAVGLANPAAVFCEEQGGQVHVRAESGGEVGYCVFPDGSECEEWAFYRGECAPGALLCNELANGLKIRLGVSVLVTAPAPFEDVVTGQSGTGCQAAASGTGLDFEMDVAYNAVRELFETQGWRADINYDAGGPTGMLGGYRQDSALCLWLVEWRLAEDATCPDDQPISMCELAPEQKLYTVAVNCLQP